MDPLEKDYPWYTPYQFAGNKPIQNIDLDGGEELNAANTGNVTPTNNNEKQGPAIRDECEGKDCQTIRGPLNDAGGGGYNVKVPKKTQIISYELQEVAKDVTVKATTVFSIDENGKSSLYFWEPTLNAFYSYSKNEVYGGEGVAIANGYMNTTWGTTWGSPSQPGYATGLSYGSGQNAVNTAAAIGSAAQIGYLGVRFGISKFVSYRLKSHLAYSLENYALTQKQSFAISLGKMHPNTAIGNQIDNLFKIRVKSDVWLKPFTSVTGRFKFGPDVYNKTFKLWWDVTTPPEWQKHLNKYSSSFGDGKSLFWR